MKSNWYVADKTGVLYPVQTEAEALRHCKIHDHMFILASPHRAVQMMDAAEALEIVDALRRIADTKPQIGMNPNAVMSDPDEIKSGWNVHWIARAAIAKAERGAA